MKSQKSRLFLWFSLVGGSVGIFLFLSFALVMLRGLGHSPADFATEKIFFVCWLLTLAVLVMSVRKSASLKPKETLGDRRWPLVLCVLGGGVGWTLLFTLLWGALSYYFGY